MTSETALISAHRRLHRVDVTPRTSEQRLRVNRMKNAAVELIAAINESVPPGRDKDEAMDGVERAFGLAAIALVDRPAESEYPDHYRPFPEED